MTLVKKTRKESSNNSAKKTLGEQGWRSGESARLPPLCPGFDSRTRRHMWAEFAPKGFSPGTPVFPSPQKPTFDLIYLICLFYLI